MTTKKRVAVIGECLIELNGAPFGKLHQTFGGDTLNTALYLTRIARERIEVQYATVVGVDPISEELVRRWQIEGIDTRSALRDVGRVPGLYWIQVDANGERSFLYWRSESAARYLLQHRNFDSVVENLAQVDLIYLTAISLAILPTEDRGKLIDILRQLAARGIAIAFDTNYRPTLWSSAEMARAALSLLTPLTRLMLVTFDDEQRLWGDKSPQETLTRLRAANVPSVVIKLGSAGCMYGKRDETTIVPTSPDTAVVDTTAAGDAFNAGFLAGWLVNRSSEECCRMGNALASNVIQHYGAIIPASATPSFEELVTRGDPGPLSP